MVQRIILMTIILTLGVSPNYLQASPLKLIQSFYEQPSVAGPPATHQEIYSPGTFQDFQMAKPSIWLGSLPPGKGDSLGKILAPQLPSALLQAAPQPSTTVQRPSPALSNPAKKAELSKRVMDLAYQHLYAPYRRGGSLQTGRATDCSGFVRYVYQNFQIDLPHSSAEQAQMGKVAAFRMDFSKLKVGDLLFFRQSKRSIGHVGIYAGEGMMIHASSRRHRVIITDLRQPYFAHTFVVAKRLIETPKPR